MQSIIAVTDKELGMYLRMLYAESIKFDVEIFPNGKRLAYKIQVDISEQQMSYYYLIERIDKEASRNCGRRGGGRRRANSRQGRQRSMTQFMPLQIKCFY